MFSDDLFTNDYYCKITVILFHKISFTIFFFKYPSFLFYHAKVQSKYV